MSRLMTRRVDVTSDVSIGDGLPFTLMAGPCVIENLELCRRICCEVQRITGELGIPYIFKASFDKANRTSVQSFRGDGMQAGLDVLAAIKAEFGVPVVTDVHQADQCAAVGEIADVIQIPAFLCRQTDLLLAAGETGRVVNIKKGQFMAPEDIAQAVRKVESTGNNRILVTERGVSFGYHNLVVDFRSLPIMAAVSGVPVVFDATHAVQQPAAQGHATGGTREYVPHLAKAAVAVGIDALFLEVHPDPKNAMSDAATVLDLADLSTLLATLKRIEGAVS
jgi:2-dehydro-3-deoxyphosphooctonate aldolase (KDO 8-P synthase)